MPAAGFHYKINRPYSSRRGSLVATWGRKYEAALRDQGKIDEGRS
jgi:hypothetical protein